MRISDWSQTCALPIFLAILCPRAHDCHPHASRFEKGEGMAHMVTVAASIKRRVHYHRVERGVMGRVQCGNIALDRIGQAAAYAAFVGEAGLQLHASYIGPSVARGRSKRGLYRGGP